MSIPAPVEMAWRVNGLQLAGLSWGDDSGAPVLALHGWLDNAASFSLLAPLLDEFHVVALDLTGHGRSSRRSADSSYQVWEDLPEILGVLEQLGWTEFNLLGHSRGALIATLLAASQSQRVERLVLLDAVSPEPLVESEFPQQLARHAADKARLLDRTTRVFPTVEKAVKARAGDKLNEQAARLIVERNLQACEGGYTWTTDPRLRGSSAVKLTEGQVQAVLAALDMPTLVLLAEEGLGKHPEVVDAARNIAELQLEWIAAGHHFHMEDSVEDVASRIRRFLREPLLQ